MIDHEKAWTMVRDLVKESRYPLMPEALLNAMIEIERLAKKERRGA